MFPGVSLGWGVRAAPCPRRRDPRHRAAQVLFRRACRAVGAGGCVPSSRSAVRLRWLRLTAPLLPSAPRILCVCRVPPLCMVWWRVSGPARCGLGVLAGPARFRVARRLRRGPFGYRRLLPLPGRHGWPKGCFGCGRVEGESLCCSSVSPWLGLVAGGISPLLWLRCGFVCVCFLLCRARGRGVCATGLPR